MSNNILVDASLRLISAAVDEYVDWYSLVLRQVYYVEYSEDLPFPERPKSILSLQELLKSQPDMTLGEIDRVFKASTALQSIVEQTLLCADQVVVFTHTQFSDFVMLYDDMMHRLHRIERSRYLVGFGFDNATGLRSGDVMYQELDREMERVARRGRAFSLAFARLDNATELQERLGAKFSELQHYIGQAVLYTIRTFDDAYHLDDHEFVMTLKHADLQGAQRFVARLRDYMQEKPLEVDGQRISCSLSFCVAEPVAGENLHQFLDKMRQDLGMRAEKENDALVYYEEESPIRRFMREKSGQ